MKTLVLNVINQMRPYAGADRFAFENAASTYISGKANADLRKAIVEHITHQPATPKQTGVLATCEVMLGHLQQSSLF